jgi:4-hydroxy-3-polyprenylbenzoate decarboxylase
MSAPERAGGKVIVVGVTGASGAVYAQAAVRLLDRDERVARVLLVASEPGLRLLATELGVVAADPRNLPELLLGGPTRRTAFLPNKDIGAEIASGSSPVDAMIVIPCSAGTLASIACGLADDLLARAADVCLKERRRLVLCLRETPLNRIHIENMLRVTDAGAVVMPAMPSFYFGPQTVEDLVTQYVCRALAVAGLEQPEQLRWTGRSNRVRADDHR